jgi:ectoine hydroxylase-related dioxygenase (phytanoyl-CoA dioxygenase family)
MLIKLWGSEMPSDNFTDDKSAAAIETAREAGWALFCNYLSDLELHDLQQDVISLIARPADHKHSAYFFETSSEDDRRLTRVERIWESLSTLHNTSLGEKLLSTAQDYLAEPAILFKDKVNIRYSGTNGYAPHQDSAAGWFEFSNRFVSLGVFLSHSNRMRGGFEVASHVHRLGHFDNLQGRMRDEDFKLMNPQSVEANPGDLILLDSETPHRTVTNTSGHDIFHLLFTFANARTPGVRDAYYTKKLNCFARGQIENNFEFRVFAF